MRWRGLLLVLGLLAPLFTTLGRPVDFDETNFLALARGAAADPWRPHDIVLNWQGSAERAFDVLSNPPGVAWWLAPVATAAPWVQRTWMLPWVVLAAWGAAMLGRRFARSPVDGTLCLLASPIVLVSTTALLPDMPLYACTLAGVGGFVDRVDRGARAWPFALLAGSAALFRYSGAALVPVLLLYAWLHRRPLAPALAALAPLGLLGLHDLHAYGGIHALAMGRFQSVATTGDDYLHKAAAAVAMLGGAAALPLFPWGRRALVGGILGAALSVPFGGVGAGFGALGGAALSSLGGGLVPTPGDDRGGIDRRFLLAWGVVGCVFLLGLRFTAARYWLPFLPAILLAMPATWPRLRVGLGLGLGALLALDGSLQASANEALAERVASRGLGRFVGHWGWQHHLEAAGWTALDEGSTPPPGSLVAIPRQAWPQAVNVRCDTVLWTGVAVPPLLWLPRSYSAAVGANLHASWVAGKPPVRTVVPWWFATDPYESARLCAE